MVLYKIFNELNLPIKTQDKVLGYLDILKSADVPTYDHSIRVGDMCFAASKKIGLDPVVMALSGLLHDVGKSKIDPKILNKHGAPTEAEWEEIMKHPEIGYNMLKGDFPNIAEIVLRHHLPQENKYPVMEVYSPNRIVEALNVVDFYDSLVRRPNSQMKFNGFTSVKELILNKKPEQKVLINELYDAGIFKI